jgi:PAS domain S-box-containing protein
MKRPFRQVRLRRPQPWHLPSILRRRAPDPDRYRVLCEHGPVSFCELDLRDVRDAVRRIERRGTPIRHHAMRHPGFVEEMIGRVRVVRASRHCREMFGLATTGIPGATPSWVLVAPQSMEAIRVQLEAIARGSCPVRREMVFRRSDGGLLHLAVSAQLPPDGGAWHNVLVAVHDRTPHTLAEEKFRLAVERAPTAMILVTEDGRIALVNAEAEALFGWPREDLLGAGLDVLLPERYRSRHPALVRSFFAEPSHREMGAGRDLHGLRRDGSEVSIEIGLNPLVTSDGTFVLASIIDITERKLAEERIHQYSRTLERTNRELEISNRELEDFAHVASHDLQEPLRKITTFSGLLRRDAGDLNEAAQRDVDYIVDAADRMRHLIRDLLALSRAGRSTPRKETLELGIIVDEALQRLSLTIEEAHATIDRDDLPTIVGDATLLTQLFQNLIGNAIKFGQADRAPHVRVTAEHTRSGIVLGVRDNGIGIRETHRKRIFAPFQRLHGRGEYEGTGVGLAICRHTVKRHGGRIWVEDAEGGGTHFRFTLPGVAEEEQHSVVESDRPERDDGVVAAGAGVGARQPVGHEEEWR